MYCFRKIKTRLGDDYVLVFNQSTGIQEPLLVLSAFDVDELTKEWKKK